MDKEKSSPGGLHSTQTDFPSPTPSTRIGSYRLLQKIGEKQKRVLGEDHPDTLRTRHKLATTYVHQGRYDQAEPAYMDILERRRRVLGDDHPDTLGVMNNLSMLYTGQGRYHEARQLLEAAIALTGEARGTEDANHAVLIHTLGELMLATGNLAATCAMLARSQNARPPIPRPGSLSTRWTVDA